MEMILTDDVKQDVVKRLLYNAKSAKTDYFVAEAMGDTQMMKFYQDKYDKAMNWLIAHKLA